MNVNINTAVYEELLQRGFSPEFAALTLQYAESYFAIDEADGYGQESKILNPNITHSPTTAEDVIPSSSRVVA